LASDCVFCRILAGELPAYFVYRGRGVAVFLDIYPVSEGHVLVVPEEHYEGAHDAPPRVAARVFAAASALARVYRVELGAPGVNIITNSGRAAGQEVFHFHVHVIPRWRGGGWRALLSGRHPLTEEEAERVLSRLKPHAHIIDEYLAALEG